MSVSLPSDPELETKVKKGMKLCQAWIYLFVHCTSHLCNQSFVVKTVLLFIYSNRKDFREHAHCGERAVPRVLSFARARAQGTAAHGGKEGGSHQTAS